MNQPTKLVLRSISAATAGVMLAGCQTAASHSKPAPRGEAVPSVPSGPYFLQSTMVTPAEAQQPPITAQVWQPAQFEQLPKQLPLIVFLHGRGESGTDGQKQTTVGIGPWAKKHPEWFPAVILMPQKPDEQKLWPEYASQVLTMIDTLVTTEGLLHDGRRIDPDRIILTGLSQGGHGTWHVLKSRPDLFAAGVPVCGWGTQRTFAGGQGFGALGNVPIWAFHGERDDVVPADSSRGLVDAVRAARAAGSGQAGDFGVKLTVFPEANHNSWDPAYSDKALADWMMRQIRQR